jgi:hypothetical protein
VSRTGTDEPIDQDEVSGDTTDGRLCCKPYPDQGPTSAQSIEASSRPTPRFPTWGGLANATFELTNWGAGSERDPGIFLRAAILPGAGIWILTAPVSSAMPHAKSRDDSSKVKTWTGYVFSALPVLFMLMSSAMKLSQQPMVVEGFAKSGMSAGLVVAIGVVELSCVIAYLVPATSVLGAILVTGYLGGAIMVHVRAGEVAFIAPLLLGMLAWGGLYMRDERIRALLPTRKQDR